MKIPHASSAVVLLSAVAMAAMGQAPKAIPGYSVSVFAKGVQGKFSAPDSIAVLKDHVFIGYGDGNDPTGADGKSNQIVEYDTKGRPLQVYTLPGHNDGLKVNPSTGQIWAMQNEDATPNLVIINPVTHTQKLYTFATAPPHGGGYDDIVFRNGKVYCSASNPANNPNQEPAIVEATFAGDTINVTSALAGDASAVDAVTGTTVTLTYRIRTQ